MMPPGKSAMCSPTSGRGLTIRVKWLVCSESASTSPSVGGPSKGLQKARKNIAGCSRPWPLVSSFDDITERFHAEARLRQAASVFDHANEGILITDPDGLIVDVNAAFTRITGYAREEALGRNPRLLSSGRHDAAFYARMWETLIEHGHWVGEIWNRRKSGEVYAQLATISAVKSPEGQTQRYVALFSDITTRVEHQQQLEHIARHDALTGLPNRFSLETHLEQALRVARRDHKRLAMLFIDLDRFKHPWASCG